MSLSPEGSNPCQYGMSLSDEQEHPGPAVPPDQVHENSLAFNTFKLVLCSTCAVLKVRQVRSCAEAASRHHGPTGMYPSQTWNSIKAVQVHPDSGAGGFQREVLWEQSASFRVK